MDPLHAYSCYYIMVSYGDQKSGCSHMSYPALELQSRAVPSFRGNITAQSILTQGEIPEEGS